MFKWFNKDKNKAIKKIDETVETEKVKNINNYETEENGNIKICVEKINRIGWYCTYKDSIVILKSSIISHTENSIVFKDYKYRLNLEPEIFDYYNYKPIENKENLIRYKDTQIKTYEYLKESKIWKHVKTEVVGTEVVSEKTPLEIFKGEFKSKYKLIDTENEFNEYITSTLDCNTWCRKKLYDKMKELGLGDGFINQFADLVGNDLDKYYAMIDLANEVSDKDTLMYLYTYKFKQD